MSRTVSIAVGDLIDLYDEGDLVSAVVVGEEKSRFKVVTQAGRQLRVTSSRIAHRAGPAPGPAAQGAAAEHARAAADKADQIDLPALWDVLVDEPERHGLDQLAVLALGEDSPVARSAVLRLLHRDRVYFSRKLDRFEPRTRELVEETHRRERLERARAARREAFIGLAREAMASGGTGRGSPVEGLRREYGDAIADLVELALMGEEAPSRKDAIAILDEAGSPDGTPADRAFGLLRALGLFHEDENLYVQRFRIRTAFPEEVERAARGACEEALPLEADGEARRDLRDRISFTVDDETTTEMDDAISIEELESGAVRIGVHIADPGHFVRPGDPVDVEAMSRGVTYYFPERKIPMIPAVVSERAASLVAGEDRPAVSVLVDLPEEGDPEGVEVVRSIIRSRARLTYDAADGLLEGRDEPSVPIEHRDAIAASLRRLRAACERLEARRRSAGASRIRAPEVDITVDPAGRVTIRRIDERGPSRHIVSEAMILANAEAAAFCVRNDVPAVYRRQSAVAGAPPEAPEEDDPDAGYDPVAVRARRKGLRRGETGLIPAPHQGLGLAAYTQMTSPIRRYMDLVMQRQIVATLLGRPVPYDAEALARVAATAEETERNAREAERGTDEYWILKHYGSRQGEEITGVVVSLDPRRTVVELEDTLHAVSLARRPDHCLGQRLRLVIEASRPRAGRLTLRELP